MKKDVLVTLMFLLFSFLYGQQYPKIKVAEFTNGNNEGELKLRYQDEIDSGDDESGNYLTISDDGCIYIHDFDNQKINEYNPQTKTLNTVTYTSFLDYPYERLQTVYDDGSMFFYGHDRFEAFDKGGKTIFSVMPNWPDYPNIKNIMYDKDENIVFWWDYNNYVHTLIHPDSSKKNYMEFLIEIIGKIIIVKGETDILIKNYGIENDKYLTKNESRVYWIGKKINGASYYISELYAFRVNMPDKSKVIMDYPRTFGYSEIRDESAAIHPCGDFYVLEFNSIKNIHTLYRVENTWDPAWRKQWYKEHK